MNGLNNFGKHLAHIITDMCAVVGADPAKIDFKKDKWFRKYSWSEEIEKGFESWLTGYLYANAEARRELMAWPAKNKKNCNKAAKEFIFQYGWTYDKRKS